MKATKKFIWDHSRTAILGPFQGCLLKQFVYYFYQAYSFFWRVRFIEDPDFTRAKSEGKKMILAFWHGQELMIVKATGPYRPVVLTSASKDGQIMAHAITKMGGAVAEGSSSRKAVHGLKALIRELKNRQIAAIAVDGPKGPALEPKAGALELARLLNLQIVLLSAVGSSGYVFRKSWNQALLPYPFSKVVVYFSSPLNPDELGSNTPEALSELGRRLNKNTVIAQEKLRLVFSLGSLFPSGE